MSYMPASVRNKGSGRESKVPPCLVEVANPSRQHGRKNHNGCEIIYHPAPYDYDDGYYDEGYDTEDYDDEDDINCFGCGLAVDSFSAMLFHLESGNCECRTTRDALNRLALGCHTSNRFVVRGREEFLQQGQSYRRARQSHFNPRTQYWECPWCNFSGTSFHGLDMHLLSPVHDVKAFICPNQYCRQQFVNLSGLVAHVESYRCGEELWRGGQSVGKLLDHLESKLLARH